MLICVQSRWQRAIALAIALFTLAPGSLTLLGLNATDGETCGMSCCRRMKTCCCRKAKPHAQDLASPQWKAAPGCSEGCRQRASLPPIVRGLAASERPKIRFLPARAALPTDCQIHTVSMCAAYAQFQRPPPHAV
jgi:hypothetical protein